MYLQHWLLYQKLVHIKNPKKQCVKICKEIISLERGGTKLSSLQTHKGLFNLLCKMPSKLIQSDNGIIGAAYQILFNQNWDQVSFYQFILNLISQLSDHKNNSELIHVKRKLLTTYKEMFPCDWENYFGESPQKAA